MSDFTGIAGVCLSVQRLIAANFAQSQPVPGNPTKVVLARTTDFEGRFNVSTGAPALALFVCKVVVNHALRTTRQAGGSQEARSHLPLNIHFLLIPFADSAESEYRILGRTLECLEATPVLSGTLLDPGTSWAPDEGIQIVAEEISTETIMRMFESLPIAYRLSAPYIARGLRLETKAPAGVHP